MASYMLGSIPSALSLNKAQKQNKKVRNTFPSSLKRMDLSSALGKKAQLMINTTLTGIDVHTRYRDFTLPFIHSTILPQLYDGGIALAGTVTSGGNEYILTSSNTFEPTLHGITNFSAVITLPSTLYTATGYNGCTILASEGYASGGTGTISDIQYLASSILVGFGFAYGYSYSRCYVEITSAYMNTGKPISVCISYINGAYYGYINGVVVSLYSSEYNGPSSIIADKNTSIMIENLGGYRVIPRFQNCMIFNSPLTNAEVFSIYKNPWQLLENDNKSIWTSI